MLGVALKPLATSRHRCNQSSSSGHTCGTPRTPRSPQATASCATSPRISRRRWGTPPHAAPLLTVEPAAPSTPSSAPDLGAAADGASAGSRDSQAQAQPADAKPVYDCVDVATQSLAVNLTLEEYKQLAGCLQEQPVSNAAAPAQQLGAAAPPAAVQSHTSLSSADLDSMGLCNHCRYPCYLSGMPGCEASHYLQMWDDDANLKPRGFDRAASLQLHGLADIAAVSLGGRANGRWKPDNQDAFLVQPAASAGSAADRCAPAAAAAIGVFDGHGRLGAAASAIVRQAMADRLAAAGTGDAEAAPGFSADGDGGGAAQLLGGCFAAAEAALHSSGRDFTKSGCTAVLALLSQHSVSVAWAGDSRAVLGVRDAGGSLASLSSGGSFDAGAPPPVCAAVPLTEDHKPDKPTERDRITACGGRVARLATDRLGNPAGPFRVFVPACWSPGLALSRAFGDTLAGTVGVISQPEVTVLPLPTPPAPPAAPSGVTNATAASCCSSSSDSSPPAALLKRHVLIVASDGLWEWVSNATAVAVASAATTAEDAAHALVEAAQKQWAVRYRGRNCDDITVVVAFLDS